MDSLTLPILKNASGSSSSNTVNKMMDLELGTNVNHEMTKPVLGVWQYPRNLEHCCIYRVPHCLRRENPEAYTPQLVLIGPLHYFLKSQALKFRGDTTKEKFMGYLNMEAHKKIYLAAFTKRLEGRETIDSLKRIVEEDEARIRASYSESTAWIESSKFVEMILHDSVFILEYILRTSSDQYQKIGDPLVDELSLQFTINRDFMLLENQLPYFILEKLFAPFVKLNPENNLTQLVIFLFGLSITKSVIESKFKHFTDLMRFIRVRTLPEDCQWKHLLRENNMYNADKLHSGGVKFKAIKENFSLHVEFVDGCLMIPTLMVDDDTEITLRNVMALEQCHYPYEAHVCNYISFFDNIIDTAKDVDLLVGKEIINNWIGENGVVAKMINKLCLGIINSGSYHTEIESSVKAHYESRCNKSYATLRGVYFNNLWRGTASVAAACALLMTLTQTVTSIISIINKK